MQIAAGARRGLGYTCADSATSQLIGTIRGGVSVYDKA
jgi:hypothetical protein